MTIKLIKSNQKKKIKIFFNTSIIGSIKIFFINKIILIKEKIQIKILKQKIIFCFNENYLYLKYNNIFFFLKKNKFLITTPIDEKKKLNLYNKLIKYKLKGILQKLKLTLILKGIGFKALIKNNNLILKLGFSHNFLIFIPLKIEILIKGNKIIFLSYDYIFLNQFIFFIKNLKKVDSYKGKGIFLENEKILLKEGKKSKK